MLESKHEETEKLALQKALQHGVFAREDRLMRFQVVSFFFFWGGGKRLEFEMVKMFFFFFARLIWKPHWSFQKGFYS